MALKRQQAAEDAIALGIRASTTSCDEVSKISYLKPGPVFPTENSGEEDVELEAEKPTQGEVVIGNWKRKYVIIIYIK